MGIKLLHITRINILINIFLVSESLRSKISDVLSIIIKTYITPQINDIKNILMMINITDFLSSPKKEKVFRYSLFLSKK